MAQDLAIPVVWNFNWDEVIGGGYWTGEGGLHFLIQRPYAQELILPNTRYLSVVPDLRTIVACDSLKERLTDAG